MPTTPQTITSRPRLVLPFPLVRSAIHVAYVMFWSMYIGILYYRIKKEKEMNRME